MGEYVGDAVHSVANYNGQHSIELVIVNDGSTDGGTLKVLEELEGQGYFVLNQANSGLAAARNNGISRAKGEFIIPLDADNKIRARFIDVALERFNTPEVDIVYGDALLFGERQGRWEIGYFDFPRLLMGNYIDACACFRKDVWDSINGYDEKMPYMGSEDWDFWLRAHLRDFEFDYVPEVLFEYRVREGSMVEGARRKGKVIAEYMFSKPELAPFKEVRDRLWSLEGRLRVAKREMPIGDLFNLLLKKFRRKLGWE